MPSSLFFHVEALDGIDGGLGDTGITMPAGDQGFVTCSDGSYASSQAACPTDQCGPGEIPVTSSDWAKPICMTGDMAIQYGKGLQAQAPSRSQSPNWLTIGAIGLGALLLGSLVGGRRR